MMRVLLIYLLLIPLSSLAQYDYKTDTSCYAMQGIAFQNDSSHRSFFVTEKGMSLFQTVYYLNRSHLLDIVADKDFIASCCVELFTNYKSALMSDSTQHIFHDYEMTWDVEIYGFLKNAASRTPLRNENYEYIETTDAHGNISLAYPEIDTVYFGFVSIPEILIEEKMVAGDVYSDELFEQKMKIERFGFTAFDYSGRPELFWVDFDLFLIALKKSDIKTTHLPWYEMMTTRSYGGFRYKQAPCDDNVYRH